MMFEESKSRLEHLFKLAYVQLTQGCGRRLCLNPLCASSPHAYNQTESDVIKFLYYVAEASPRGNLTQTTEFVLCSKPFVTVYEICLEEINTLESAYSLPEHLLGLFLIKFPTRTDPGINFKKVARVQSYLQDLVSGWYLNENWLESKLLQYTQSPYSKMYIPGAVLTLLAQVSAFPLNTVLQLCKLIKEHGAVHDQVSVWLDTCSVEVFSSGIETLTLAASQLNIDRNTLADTQAIIAVLTVLNLFFRSNKRVRKVEESTFVIEAISKNLVLGREFERWRKPWAEQRTLPEHKKFSFLQFYWLLSLEQKAVLFQFEKEEVLEGLIIQGLLQGRISAPVLTLQVRRDFLLQDTVNQLLAPGVNLRKPLRVSFQGEEGVDQGGPKKEFFTMIIKELFDPSYGMFLHNSSTNLCWIHPFTVESNLTFELVGAIMGMAVSNSINLDLPLPLAIYKKIQNETVSLEELKQIDPELHSGLTHLLNFEGDVEATFCRSFQIDFESTGVVYSIELLPGGSQIPVTKQNRQLFVELVVQWWLNDGVHNKFEAFKKGFLKACGGKVIRMFSSGDLEKVICGYASVDLHELERVTRYENGYSVDSQVVKFI